MADAQEWSAAHLESRLHGRQISKGHLPGGQLPEEHGEAPHVGRPDIDLLALLLQRFRSHPLRIVAPALVLEREPRIRHADPSSQVLVNLTNQQFLDRQ